MKRVLLLVVVIFLSASFPLAHPHFTKTVSGELQGNQLTLRFTTYPYNEEHLAQVEKGFIFHCGRATLTLAGNVKSGGRTIDAGEYLVRAQANSVDSWTLILVPKSPVGSANLDVSSGIKLQTTTLTGLPSSHHLDLNLYSGHGSTDGKLIVSVAFGERKVEGVLEVN
jgi:hypothetical protein